MKVEVIPTGKFGKTGTSLGVAEIPTAQLQGMYFQVFAIIIILLNDDLLDMINGWSGVACA